MFKNNKEMGINPHYLSHLSHNKNMELVILCIKIFFARIIDVTLGTIRTVFIVNEKKLYATLIAFVEVLIWFEIARTALNIEINTIMIPISYSAGYATGTYIGMLINKKIKKRGI